MPVIDEAMVVRLRDTLLCAEETDNNVLASAVADLAGGIDLNDDAVRQTGSPTHRRLEAAYNKISRALIVRAANEFNDMESQESHVGGIAGDFNCKQKAGPSEQIVDPWDEAGPVAMLRRDFEIMAKYQFKQQGVEIDKGRSTSQTEDTNVVSLNSFR